MVDQWKLDGGVILVDKPLEWTSFDAVKKLRNVLGYKKIGHAGTLDPLASGLLILCFGKFTKRIEEIQQMGKVYEADLKLGETTPSFDAETEVDKQRPFAHITLEEIQETLKDFIGHIQQYPPKYSAVKVNGKRAYSLARKGEEVELKSREVRIDAIEVLSYEAPVLKIRMHCGKGTYVRSLARDVGEALGCGAHLTFLRRSQIGGFKVEDAHSPKAFSSEEDFYLQRITAF